MEDVLVGGRRKGFVVNRMSKNRKPLVIENEILCNDKLTLQLDVAMDYTNLM